MFLRGALIYSGGCRSGDLDDGAEGAEVGWGEWSSTDGDGAWRVDGWGRHGGGVVGNGVWFLPGHV